MKSPFPGMDPYLERRWLDVHARMVTYAADQLNERLPRALAAQTEERVAIEAEDTPGEFRTGPDVMVTEPGRSDRATTGIDYASPVKLVVMLDPIKEHFIEVINAEDERLITVIEMVSPTNKRGAGLAAFRKKRDELTRSGVHVVEIDLVRRGNWRALLEPHICPQRHITEYRATVRLAGDPATTHFHPMPLREKLPGIPIPLRQGDPEVRLNLQELVEMVYTRGRYGQRLHYERPLDPPLSPEDAQWAEQLLANRQSK